MGLLDFLTGRKAPAPGVAPRSAAEVRAALLAANRPTAPYTVRDGAAEGADLVAEWKIVDASWYEIFAKAHLEKAFKVLMRLDGEKHEVRAVDQEWSVAWRAGVPTLSLSAEAFRGTETSVQFGTGYAFTEELRPGQVYRYRFATGELKTPLQEAALAAGWTWRPVSFGKL